MGHEWDQPGEYGPVRANGYHDPASGAGHGYQREALQDHMRRSQRRSADPAPTSGEGEVSDARARREGVKFGGPLGRQHTGGEGGSSAAGGAMHAGRYDLSPDANMRFQLWCQAWAAECWRVLKPGGHMLVFGGTRTFHRMASGLEDAGFEIRDCLMWLYGSGFPKSLNVGKAIDKAARGVPQGGEDPTSVNHGRFRTQATEGSRGDGDAGRGYGAGPGQFMAEAGERDERELVAEAQEWEGWGTALKPAWEPIVVARKPLAGTVVQNVLEHGTGAVNVDGCRVAFATSGDEGESKGKNRHGDFGTEHGGNQVYGDFSRDELRDNYDPPGRWPANVVLAHDEDCVLVGERQVRADGHFPAERGASGYGSAVEESTGGGLKGQGGLEERSFDGERVEVWACVPGCPVRMLDDQSGVSRSTGGQASPLGRSAIYGTWAGTAERRDPGFGDVGGASRFFYCAKASRAERNAGLDAFEKRPLLWSSGEQNPGSFQAEGTERAARNPHPTVKPIDLMRWLVRLVTPPGGTVLDPFTGSGTTGCAAALEGVEFVGVERDADYVAIAEARIRFWREHPTGLPAELALKRDAERRRVRDSGQLGFEV